MDGGSNRCYNGKKNIMDWACATGGRGYSAKKNVIWFNSGDKDWYTKIRRLNLNRL